MQYVFSTLSDIGISRETNQDSCLALGADTDLGPVMMAAVCDGMGGFEDGEIASRMMVTELENFFSQELHDIIYEVESRYTLEARIFAELRNAINNADGKIYDYSQTRKIKSGTTAVILLLFQGRYYIANVGDSRAYLYRKRLFQITKDQTKVQQMVDNGELSEEMAKIHKDRSVLLQCVGMNRKIVPEFRTERCMTGDVFILCSDGFHHKISSEEIEKALKEDDPRTKAHMQDLLRYLVEENKNRHETDNITAIMVRTDDPTSPGAGQNER